MKINYLIKICLICIVIFLTLVSLEAVLRYTNILNTPPIIGAGVLAVSLDSFIPDRELIWKLNPSSGHGINSFGFRGREFKKKKKDDVYRIVCMGNSCTFEIKIPGKNTYPIILENMLNENSKKRFEVINAGVPGYSSFQMLKYFKKSVVNYNPDMVIIQYGENDEEGTNKQQSPMPVVVYWLRNKLLKFKVFRLVNMAYWKYQNWKFENDIKYQQRIKKNSFSDCLKNLKEMKEFAKKANSKIYFILPTWTDGKIFVRQERFLFEPYIDIFDELNTSGIATYKLYKDDHHWTEKGHELVAKAIYKKLYKELGSNQK